MSQLKPLEGFEHFYSHHCVTGSVRHIYVFNDHPLSEEMLLGIGGGVGFVYWHMKGTEPFIGGRSKGRPGDSFEVCIGERTGVLVEEHVTSSAGKAERALLDMLTAGQAVMLQVDMGFLPYFDFGDYDFHFGAHAIVACGYDAASGHVLIADREEELYPVSLEDLAKARGSTYKPFPPRHKWFTFDFSQKRQPSAEGVRAAIAEQVERMLEPPISNFGVPGIRKAARRALKWPQVLDEQMLRATMYNAFIFIDATGGSGGGLFRYMFGRFLKEAAEIIVEPRLEEVAEQFQHIGDRWQDVAVIFEQGWEAADPAGLLPQTTAPLLELADLEEAAWTRLGAMVPGG